MRGRGVAPVRGFIDERPAVLAGDDEMAPAGMQRYGKRRITLACGVDHEIDRGIEAAEVDTKVGELTVEPDRQHSSRTVADRLGVQ